MENEWFFFFVFCSSPIILLRCERNSQSAFKKDSNFFIVNLIPLVDSTSHLRRGFLSGACPVMLQGTGGPGAPHHFEFNRRESFGFLISQCQPASSHGPFPPKHSSTRAPNAEVRIAVRSQMIFGSCHWSSFTNTMSSCRPLDLT